MEGLVILLCVALIVGLVLRKKGDNTMDTLSKGCGCLIAIAIIVLIMVIMQQE